MESASQVNVPLRSGGKKMRKRRELDALVAHSLAKRANKKTTAGNGVNSQDQLLSPSTDEQEDFAWPKVIRGSNRSRHRKFSFIRLCAPLVFVTCISLSLGFMYWLYFDLRQQLYEYRQKIEEVTVTSQNLPETLQKWHETSKNLEQNQTIIYGKLFELQHSLENLNGNFTQYKNKLLNDKNDYSKDEKFVADFGAKIEAVTVDVKSMKEKFSDFQISQDNFKNDVIKLKENFTDVLNKAASLTNNRTVNCSVEIDNLKNQAFDKINSLSTNVSAINFEMSEKIKGLDDELIKHKKLLDELSDSSANTTSHVTSIEEDWIKYKEKFGQYELSRNEMKSQIFELKNATTDLDAAIRDVRSTCNKYHYEMIQNFEQMKMKDMSSNSQIMMKDKIINNNNEELKNLNQSSKNSEMLSNAQSIVNLNNDSNNLNYNLNTNTNNNNATATATTTTNMKITTSTNKQIPNM